MREIGKVILMAMFFTLCSCHYFTYPTLSNKDKTELIRLTLEQVLDSKEMPFYSILCDTTDVIVSSYYMMKQGIMPKVDNINLIVLNYDEIKERADSLGPFMFLSFYFIPPDYNRAYVSLWARWALPMGFARMGDFAESVIDIDFRKETGKWIPGKISYPEVRFNYDPDKLH